jgi:peptide/nickel transport system permease protein
MTHLLTIVRQILKRPISLFGAILICTIISVALVPDLIATHDPYDMIRGGRLLPPSKANLFGTDEMGRDMFSRIVHGIGLSLQAGMTAVLIATVFGTFLGTIAGFFGGRWFSNVIMRVADIFLAFPPLVMAMAIVAAIGPSLAHASLALGVVWWPQYTRLTFAQVSSAKNFLYVEAARAGGIKTSKILYTASLSFLGLGAPPPIPELGTLITMGRAYLLDFWWYPTFPGFAIFITVMGFNLFGDGIRDALDPSLRV